MKELTLHIGLPKTGTSTLQHYLTANVEELRKQGICYPATGRSYVAHHGIAHACRRVLPTGRELHELRNAFDAEVADFDRVILSSEAFQDLASYPGIVYFFGLPNRSQTAFSTLLPLRVRPYHVKTFCYLREFLEFASSSYAQKIQNTNSYSSFEKFCGAQFRRPLTYFTGFWGWYSDEIQYSLFERTKLRNENIVDDFFWQAGATMPSQAASHDANPSISGNLLTFKQLLNSHKLHSPGLYRALSELAQEDPAYRGRFKIPATQAKALRQRFHNYNEAVRRLVGEIPNNSFENEKPLFDMAAWKHDVERFLSHPKLSQLRDNPKINQAISDTAYISSLQ